MKKEELIKLGIDDETAKKILEINGADIENAKTKASEPYKDYETLKSKNEDLASQLETANKQIEDFKGMDIESIKKSAEQYKEQYENAKTESEKKLAEIERNHAIELYASNPELKFSSKAAKTAFISELRKNENVKFDSGKLLCADDVLKTYREEDPAAFAVEKEGETPAEGEKTLPKFAGPGNQNISGNKPASPFDFSFSGVRPKPTE